MIQHKWDKIVLKKKTSELTFDDPRYIARMKGVQNKEFVAWLHAFPPKNIDMFIDDRSFQITIGF